MVTRAWFVERFGGPERLRLREREDLPGQLHRAGFVDLRPASVLDLDADHVHRLRAVPVSSACCLYASTIR